MPAKSVPHKLKTALVKTTGQLLVPSKSPDEALGEFFREVQAKQVYEDGKTFVDLIPRKRARQIIKEYKLAQKDPNFDLRDFVSRHFYEFMPERQPEYIFSPNVAPREHVRGLWGDLERRNRVDRGSLIALPHEYVVPGGRFSEQFYWDSYFIMLGLAADKKWETIHGMMKNYQYMIRKFGFIPTANRTYFLSRSQPPFFAQMVKLLSKHRGKTRTYLEFLPALLAEYRFWMKGRRSVNEHVDHRAYARVVQMPNGVILNRYYDDKATPRPESLREDLETAERSESANKDKLFLDLRAGAESGWDFSSRWFRNSKDIESIHTTDIVPVDLNCLLYQLEMTIAETYQLLRQPLLKRKFQAFAEKRAQTLLKYCWDEKEQFFCDYDFREGKSTGRITLAGVFPLYAKLATSQQAKAVAERLEKEFLMDGGLVTTLTDNGQQWDYPNGWAPLQWVAIQGLREYGYHHLAEEIKRRWLRSTEMVFSTKHKMIEKYDVVNKTREGGGGEYPLQDGFGWTNGVYAALKDEDLK
ncbi:alpha,alpha-trehalase TreF [Candidatus Saccharibacteria bacterium]|nr:alpha,alpha-trehalase TreF [Candidatus Saccharibacteria bacterium]